MKPDWKKEWLQALRSGKYTQARGGLRMKGRHIGSSNFCCLGVLCDVIEPNRWIEDPDFNGFEYKGYRIGRPLQANFPPDFVLKKTELTEDQAAELARLNDQGRSFEYIADFIEEHL